MAHFQVNDGLNHPYPLNKPGMVGDQKSPLITKIEEGHGEVSLSETEIKHLRYWINTGALYPGTYGALGTGMIGTMTNNRPDLRSLDNPLWDKATKIIKNDCRKCHKELMPHIGEEKNLTWWRSRVEVTSGKIEKERYEEAIRFSRHIIYNLTNPEQSTLLLAPLSAEAGGYGLCTQSGKAVFVNTQSKDYVALLEAVKQTASHLKSIKRFDMDQFVVRPDYYREMVRYGVIDESVPIEEVDPYVADSLYWNQQ
jgi:hypothetical protein